MRCCITSAHCAAPPPYTAGSAARDGGGSVTGRVGQAGTADRRARHAVGQAGAAPDRRARHAVGQADGRKRTRAPYGLAHPLATTVSTRARGSSAAALTTSSAGDVTAATTAVAAAACRLRACPARTLDTFLRSSCGSAARVRAALGTPHECGCARWSAPGGVAGCERAACDAASASSSGIAACLGAPAVRAHAACRRQEARQRVGSANGLSSRRTWTRGVLRRRGEGRARKKLDCARRVTSRHHLAGQSNSPPRSYCTALG
jgi:hypothetical protein